MIKIINNNCLDELKKMEENSIDLIVTSPPYNCKIDYNNYKDDMPWDKYWEWNEQWLGQCFRVLKEDGRIALNVLVEQGIENNKKRISPMHIFSDIMQKVGFTIMALPMWTDNHRTKFTAWGSWKNASCPYIYNPFEVIIIAYKKHKKKLNKGENTISKEDFIKGCSGIWHLKTDTNSLTKATFPVSLPKLCIELLSYKNDLVLDPFNGSGTTGVACLMTGRNYIGIEIDKQYCKISENRINDYLNTYSNYLF